MWDRQRDCYITSQHHSPAPAPNSPATDQGPPRLGSAAFPGIFCVGCTVDLPGFCRYSDVTLTVRVDLRLPEALHAALKEAARAGGRSLHGEVLWRLGQLVPVAGLGEGEPSGGGGRASVAAAVDSGVRKPSGSSPSPRPVDTVDGAGPVARALAGRGVESAEAGGCPMTVPRGTRCKSCGRVH